MTGTDPPERFCRPIVVAPERACAVQPGEPLEVAGPLWLASVGRTTRPVVILTRGGVIDVRALVAVAEISTAIRGHGAEVDFDHERVGLGRPSVVNCDGLHTVPKHLLTRQVGTLDPATMDRVCSAVAYAIGC